MDITRITKIGRLRTDDDMKRLIELKRLFKGKGILEPVKLKGHCERVYRFPHDIWWIIGQYLETYSLIKLEKTCKAFYKKYNE